ncbi:MAG TPA: sulfurtransferase complex subunit TusC [Kangiella sp.]|uniref:sulfurtransferase complex subunit TusC n=1 Tax=Kangiella sp. TaxID=1920245 RepID=UPI002F92AB39
MNKSICIVFNKAPYGSQSGRELLDIALMAAAFDMPITAIFIDQGVYQLLKGQEPDILHIKNHSATFKALPLYGIEEVYVEQQAMQQFKLDIHQLLEIDGLQQATTDGIRAKIAQSDFVLTL